MDLDYQLIRVLIMLERPDWSLFGLFVVGGDEAGLIGFIEDDLASGIGVNVDLVKPFHMRTLYALFS